MWLCLFALDALYGAAVGLFLEFAIIGGTIAALLVFCLYLTRACAPENRLRPGRVLPWLGWSLMAALPLLPWFVASMLMLPEYDLLAESPYWWLDALAISALGACGLAFLVFGSGHAIDGDQPRFSVFWTRMKPRSIPGGIAYFLICLPSYALSNYADWFLMNEAVSNGTRWISYAAASLVDALSMVLGTALSVIMFLQADASRAD